MKYAQIFALGTILAMLSLLVGGGCAALSDAQVDRLMASLTDALDAYASKHQPPDAPVEPPAPETPGQPATPPPASETGLTGQERGFLWKPIGENSKKLRVLLPPQFTGKVDLKAVELWHGAAKIETLNAIGPGNPTAAGPREHFAGKKPGGAYNAGTQVRANAEGTVWVWTIAKTGSRNENLKAAKISEAAAPIEPEPTWPPVADAEPEFSYAPGASSTTIYVPPDFGVWQLNIFSRRKHHTLYGPDRTTGPSWTIPMSGADLKAASLAAGDDGSIMVFVNTNREKTGDNRNAAWRIMDPTKAQSGDGDRLKAGENR